MIIKSKAFSSVTCLAYHPRHTIPRFFFNPQRQHWIWAPIQQSSSDFNLSPRPQLSLEHPDNLPPEKRYMLKISGPLRHRTIKHPFGRVKFMTGRDDAYGFFVLPHWTYRPNQSCQLVWDADSKSISVFTETEHPIPGSRRYLKDLLAKPQTGRALINFLTKKGYVTREEVLKIPEYYQTDYDLARLQEMGFSQRTAIYPPVSGGFPRFTLSVRFQSPDHTLWLRNAMYPGGTPHVSLTLDSSENCLVGHTIRMIPHIITNIESGPRLGFHLVEVVGHPKPDFTTVNRPLVLEYVSRKTQVKTMVGINPAESRPLNARRFSHGKSFLDFVEIVNRHRQQSLLS